MTSIYSYVDAGGQTLIPPASTPPRLDAVIYLARIDGRHYVAAKEALPPQAKEIDLQGPIDLRADEHRALAALLDERAEPLRRVRAERAMQYPPIGEQLDALMKELARRRDGGEKIAPELDAMLERIAEVKRQHPKEDLGLP